MNDRHATLDIPMDMQWFLLDEATYCDCDPEEHCTCEWDGARRFDPSDEEE